MQQRKKVVSRAQYRFFRDALRRIEAGGESPIKDMTLAEICFALDGVDYDSLPERAGQAARKPRPQPKRQFVSTPELVRATFEAPLRAQPLPPTCTHEHARIIDLDAYLDKHPKHAINRDPALHKAVKGGVMFQVEPDDLPHCLLRSKLAVKAVLKADPGFDRSRLWSLMEAKAFLAALGTTVRTLEEAAREMAYCPACAQGVSREEQLLARRWPQRAELPPELRGTSY
jgi:hypothetical protein